MICRLQFVWGVLFSATGVFLLMSKAAAIYPSVIRYEQFASNFWPAFLIIVGIVIVLSFFVRNPAISFVFRTSTGKGGKHSKGNWYDDYKPDDNENNDGKINYRFVFSGSEQVILDPVFKGGTIDATFGGMELDLRHTSLAEGKTYLHVTTVFGGVEITAPDNWDIELVSNSFAGGVSDSRRKISERDTSRKLIIIAKCTFGGITIE